jgi:hypothetical protein
MEAATVTPDQTETKAEEAEESTPEQRAEQEAIIGDPGIETEAPMAERTTPPAKSWAVYQYDSTAVPPAPQCHIFGYDTAGNPLDEAGANDLLARLSPGHSGTLMALPNEDAPDLPPAPAAAAPLEEPHAEQNHDNA